jgi:hypothetical protein
MLMSLLAITPIGTYFWMKGGVDYRTERLSELKDFGKIADFKATDEKGMPFDTSNIIGKMALVMFMPENKAEAKKLMERIELVEYQMEEQLDQRKDMLFLFYTTSGDLVNYAKGLMVKENDKFIFVNVSLAEMSRIKSEAYNLKQAGGMGVMTKNPLVLADLKSKIRHYYDPMVNKDMGKLVEHMAMILPQDKDKDIVFRRESEK